MTTRRVEAFMLPGEVAATLACLVWSSGFRVYRVLRGSSRRLEHVTGDMSQLHGGETLVVTPRALRPEETRHYPDFMPYIGAALIDSFPSTDADVLTLTSVASKSDAFAGDGTAVLQQTHKHEIVTAVRHLVRPHLARPVIVRSGSAERAYRDIGYSYGAARWYQDGKKWRNALVPTLEYVMPKDGTIPPPFKLQAREEVSS